MARLASPEIVLASESGKGLDVLEEYAEFWKIPFSHTQIGQDSVVLTTGKVPDNIERTRGCVVSPQGHENAVSIARKLGVGVLPRERLIRIPMSRGVFVSIRTVSYEFQGPGVETIVPAGEESLLQRVKGTRIHLMSVDLVTDYIRQLYDGLQDRPSTKFRLVTRIPFSYNAIPGSIRNRFFRSSDAMREVGEEKFGAIEFLRAAFLASISVVAQSPIPKIALWKRRRTSAVAVSHDVETGEGLRSGARRLLNVETKLGIRSTWNIPTSRYQISKRNLEALAKEGELGGHDTKHDGRLVMTDSHTMLERLTACKRDLELAAGSAVVGFRSPLLQHSRGLIASTREAGFSFDSSVPSWEPLSPTSFRPHGVGTVFPFWVEDCLEVPVTLPQDHQLIRVAGLTPSGAADFLIQTSKWISGIGGASVLLVHPDYEFALPENLCEYERLLEGIRQPGSDMMTLGEMAEWWRLRRSAGWKVANGWVELQEGSPEASRDLEIQLVRSYGEEGFKVETL